MVEVLTRAGSFVAIILLGVILKKVGVFRKEDFRVLSNIVLKITLPAAIVTSFAQMQIVPSMLSILLLGFVGGVLYIFVAFLTNLRSTKQKRAFEVLQLPGYNIGCFSMPFVQSFLGPIGVVVTGIFDAGNAIVVLGGAYGVAETVKAGRGLSVKRLLCALSRSVPFMCYVIMIFLNITHIRLPDFVLSFAQLAGSANAFAAMLMIGIGFEIRTDSKQMGTIAKIVALRYSIATGLALVFYFLLPFSAEIRRTLVLLAFSPIGAAVPAFTEALGEDVGLSSTINSVCIVISLAINVVLLSVM